MNIDDLRNACRAPLPHPDLDTCQRVLAQISAWVLDDFVTLPEKPIGATATRAQMEALLREPPPIMGQPMPLVLAEFQEKVAAHALRPQHPRFWAFIPSAPTLVSVLGDWLTAAHNVFAGVWLEAAGPTQVEILVLDWFKEFLGYPSEASGVLTSGGSEANLLALVVAREPLSWDERQRAVLYVSGQRHRSWIGPPRSWGSDRINSGPCPSVADFRLCVANLQAAVAEDEKAGRLPWAVVANAGSTNTGTIDPLEELADYCQERRLWLHVDAAYGWAAVLSGAEKELLRGIERADSLTLDPHKWFGQTFEAGCVLVKDGWRLHGTFAFYADYLQDVQAGADEINFADHGLALTRRFRALKIWLSLKVLGVAWFGRLIEHGCRLADLAQALLVQSGSFEILSPRRLSVVCFRFVPRQDADDVFLDKLNLALCTELRQSQQIFLSTTQLAGKVALRMCFVNWRTTAQDVDEGIRLLVELGNRLATP